MLEKQLEYMNTPELKPFAVFFRLCRGRCRQPGGSLGNGCDLL